MKAKIVIDLGFGDSGKGAAIDTLAMGCSQPIGVRFSGGHQCGHTVYTDKDTSHIHASFSSVALRGFPTYVTQHCTVYPPLLIEESNLISLKGGCSEIFIHPSAMLTTPFDIAWNRVTETIHRHGSVGLGIGATNSRNRDTGYKLTVLDLTYPALLTEKLNQIERYYIARVMKEYPIQIDEFMHIVGEELPNFMQACSNYAKYIKVQDYTTLFNYEEVLFEGSQGVMLDMDHGIFPHVTYSKTTCQNALELCMALNLRPDMYYVSRCYSSRHGNGWMPQEGGIDLINTEAEINDYCPWQGEFRVGPLNYDLLNYALRVDGIMCGEHVTKFLIISCIDQVPDFKFEANKITGAKLKEVFFRGTPVSTPLNELTRAGLLEQLLGQPMPVKEELADFTEVKE